GYRFSPFRILSVEGGLVDELWRFGKPRRDAAVDVVDDVEKKCKPGTISAVWTAAPSFEGLASFNAADGTKQLPKLRGSRTGLYETIIGGVKQGYKASGPGVRGASALSRAKMWGFVKDLVGEKGVGCDEKVGHVVGEASYAGFKKAALLTAAGMARRRAMQDAKKVLVPWVPNSGDEDWGLEVLVDTYTKKRKR
ncbi:hypothetical protein BO71DRAFT_338342, partial [Aspergillus ellipticus CBS 707.79]